MLVIHFCHVVLHVVVASPAGPTLAIKDNTELIHEFYHRPHVSRSIKIPILFHRLRGRTPLALWSIWWVRRWGHARSGLTQREPLSCSPQAYTSDLRLSITGPHTGFVETMYVRVVPITRSVNRPIQIQHLTPHGSESAPVRSQGKYSTVKLTCAVPLSGTGGLMEAYAILSWLSVNASLRYLLRGQLR